MREVLASLSGSLSVTSRPESKTPNLQVNGRLVSVTDRRQLRRIGQLLSSELLPEDPNSVGGYRLVGRLGAGATGVVYEAVSSDGERVAVKVLHPSLANAPGIRERLRREGVALQRVTGVRAVRVLEVDADGPRPFLAMELVEGQTLDNYVNSYGPVRGALLWGLAEGLVEALSDIHDAGIIHRDLKPSNVLLGPDGVRVVDFGISALADATSLTGTGSFVGTAAWLSPEQVQGDEVTEASDIFGLGMLLAYASAGHHPFGYGRSDAVMYRIIHSQPKLEDVPVPLLPVVIGCLMKAPEERLSLFAIQELLTEADKSNSSESDSAESGHTRVVSKDEQVQALIGDVESNTSDDGDREVLYDLRVWKDEKRIHLTEELQFAGVTYQIENDELVVDKSDEDQVDQIIDRIHRFAVTGPEMGVIKSSLKADNGTRNRAFGLVAAVLLVTGVMAATNQRSGNGDSEFDVRTSTETTNFTASTVDQEVARVRNLRSELALFNGKILNELEAIEAGEDYSDIIQDTKNAFLMTDIIQTDCRGRWIINEVLARTGMSTVLYDMYFSNYLINRDYPSRHIVTRVAVTVLRNPNPEPNAFGQEAIGVLGDYTKLCDDQDFAFSPDAPIDSCAKFFPAGSWSMITADPSCLKGALRSIPWETDSTSSKSYELNLDSDRWGAQGDSLAMAGKGFRLDGTSETSMILLAWVDLSGEFAVVVRSHATSYDSVVSVDNLDKRASTAVADVLAVFFRVATPIIGSGSD